MTVYREGEVNNAPWRSVSICPVCNGENFSPYKRVTTAPTLVVDFCDGPLPVETVTTYVVCAACGLVIQSPRMSDERIAKYYSSGLYRETLGISQNAMDADEERRALDMSRWLTSMLGGRVTSHLDIGCSRGYLLEYVDAFIRHGFDENPSYSKVFNTTSNKSLLKIKYDLVTAVHVLEHAIDPMAELTWYKSLCSKRMLIEVPGENSKGGPLRFAHLYYFPPKLLESMITGLGMRILFTETTPHTRILAEIK